MECYVSCDSDKLNVEMIHDYLANRSYWRKGFGLEKLKIAIANSLCFGVYLKSTDEQIGFARVLSDKVTFAYIEDLFILEEYRGNGFSKKLMKSIMEHEDLQNLQRWTLLTNDAHTLYSKFGFKQIAHPERFMEIVGPVPK